MTEPQARRALVEAGQRLLAGGLVARSWGNLSVRLDANTMAVTPSGIPWAEVTEPMISLVDLETGSWTGEWKPSGERKVHREIYRLRPEVNAVVHTHQSAASVFAVARVGLEVGTERIGCAGYALPGTKALTRNTVTTLGQGSAVLMANHGVFAVGTDLDQAFDRVRALETACAKQIAALAPRSLPAKADAPWNPEWLKSGLSTAPYTVAWAARGRPLPALLDDLAQLAGTRVPVSAQMPERPPKNHVVLVKNRGAAVSGPDAEALAMVVEKTARAALGAEGLGGARSFPGWEAGLMRLVYKNAYSKQARRSAR